MREKIMAPVLAGLLLLAGPTPAPAAGELLELRNTILNLVDALVEEGIITAERAEQIRRDAVLKAREQAAREALAAGETPEVSPPADTSVVRVPYVPEFVKDQIRAEVREELREDVTGDVIERAREERWGTPDALPAWLSRISLSGDMRLRASGVFQDSSNADVINVAAINRAGSFSGAGENLLLNTTEDIRRGQLRLRLGLMAELDDGLSVVTRLATGNNIDPTTRNQRLGNFNRPFDLFVDLAYIQWDAGRQWDGHDLRLRGGRLPNPFLYTPLVFDEDLTFDGVTAGWRMGLNGGRHAVFANAGAFTLLAESPNLIDGGTNDKYWWGLQLGSEIGLSDELTLRLAGAWYDFINVTGRLNEEDSTARDWTAPEFVAKGNTVFDIRNDDNPDTVLFGLASEFSLINALLELEYRLFDPLHVVWRSDFVQNVGYNSNDVLGRVAVPVSRRNRGWGTQLEVGHPQVRAAGQWQVFAGYRYLQRDAILDSFADSNFHGGGTDAQGWIAGLLYGVSRNAWLRARYLAADEIDGAPAGLGFSFAPLAIDVLQVDFNARF